MGMPVARIGDTVSGICMYPPPPTGIGPTPCTGIIMSGNPSDMSGGIPTARIGDMVSFPIGPAFIIAGFPSNMSGGMPAARIGDIVLGPLVTNGIIMSGNPQDMS